MSPLSIVGSMLRYSLNVTVSVWYMMCMLPGISLHTLSFGQSSGSRADTSLSHACRRAYTPERRLYLWLSSCARRQL